MSLCKIAYEIHLEKQAGRFTSFVNAVRRGAGKAKDNINYQAFKFQKPLEYLDDMEPGIDLPRITANSAAKVWSKTRETFDNTAKSFNIPPNIIKRHKNKVATAATLAAGGIGYGAYEGGKYVYNKIPTAYNWLKQKLSPDSSPPLSVGTKEPKNAAMTRNNPSTAPSFNPLSPSPFLQKER